MSGNIFDTDINKIKNEVNQLLNDLDNNRKLKYDDKYKYLASTSKTLYEFIINGYNSPSFNKTYFKNNLEMMLKGVERIQKSNNIQKTQHEASVLIGEKLAEQFIPQYKEERETKK